MEKPHSSWVLPVTLSALMALVLAVRIALVWSQLPESFASHFGRGGAPDAFTSKRDFFLAMALVGGGSIAAVFASPLLVRSLPKWLINLPNRDYWLANDRRRTEALDRLAGIMGWIGTATTALLVVAIELTLQANLDRRNLDEGILLVVLALYFAFVLAAVIHLNRSFRIADTHPP